MREAEDRSREPGSERRRRPGGTAIRLLFGVLLIGLILWAAGQAGERLPAFVGWVEEQGFWGQVVFVLGYAVATVAFVPGSILTLAGGALFGVARGLVVVFLGAVLGSSLAFLLARGAARPAVQRRISGDPRFERIDRAVAENGGRIVLLLRLSPVLPYNLLNYALGLTRVRFRDYVAASVGMLPGTLLYVYSGRVAGSLAAVAAGADVPRGAGYYSLLALGLIATAVVTVWITGIAKRAIRAETESDETSD